MLLAIEASLILSHLIHFAFHTLRTLDVDIVTATLIKQLSNAAGLSAKST